jgi:replicative DNA helicase
MSVHALPSRAQSEVETEIILLGSLFRDPRRIDAVADILHPEDFQEPFIGELYAAVLREHSKGNTPTPVSIRPLVADHPGFAEIGGMEFLAKITVTQSLLVPPVETGKMLAGWARKRRLAEGLRESLALADASASTAEEIVAAAEAAIVEATERSDAVQQVSAAKAMKQLMRAAEGPKRSIVSGIVPSMDRLLGGMRPKEFVVGAGRPGMGKTAAALSFSLGAAQNGHGVLFISLEMSAKELAARMAADLAFDGQGGVPYADINSDNPSKRAFRAMGGAAAMLEDLPFHIVDAGSLTLARLDMIVRRWKRRLAARNQSLDLVVVDYLQLLRCDDKRTSSYEAVSEISRRLKAIAKDHDVAVFALAQLSREVERRGEKKPQLSDLKDSGQIEQDADAVLFFYRHVYYLRQTLPSSEHDPAYRDTMDAINACENAIDFITAKVRRGVPRSAIGDFYGAFQAVRG